MLAYTRLFFFLTVVLAFISTPHLAGQIHGVPASVTSMGFGGSNSFTPGVAASVTSLGPNGFNGGPARFSNCCFNAFGQSNVQVPFFRGRHSRHNFFAGSVPVYSVPYTQIVIVQPEAVADEQDEEDNLGGTTVFDRRGSRSPRSRHVTAEIASETVSQVTSLPATAPPPAAVVAQPSTLLVFRDGHQFELLNYAIVGDTIFDLTDNRSRKILLADVDLPATRKANDARGVDFQVPGQ